MDDNEILNSINDRLSEIASSLSVINNINDNLSEIASSLSKSSDGTSEESEGATQENENLSNINDNLSEIVNSLNEIISALSNTEGTTRQNENLNNINECLSGISNSLSITNKKIIRDCALNLYYYSNFENNSKSPIQIANECITRAFVIVKELENNNLLD